MAPSIKKQSWKNKSIVSLLKKKYKTNKINIQTDVNASAYGEFLQRKKTIKSSLAYITVGTGIGVGLVINSKPVIGMMHPEGGHIPLSRDSTKEELDFNSCSFHLSCVEGFSTNVYASNLLGVGLEDLENHQENKVFEKIGKNIGQLCASVCLMTSVEKIIVGGGLSNAKNFLNNVREEFEKNINGYVADGIIPDDYIELCEDYDKIGIKGAAFLSI